MVFADTMRAARSNGKRAVARMARRVLPRTTVRLTHVEPDIRLTVNLRRHVMFWSQGLSRFEPSSVRVLRAAVERGDVVLDAGANIGFFTTLFSRWVGGEGRVLAVEPEPENLALLRRNLEDNGCRNVTVCDCAVGEQSGVAQFSLDEATGATGHLGHTPTAGEVAVGSGRIRVVETRVDTIDSLVESNRLRPQVIKMDIEGGEAGALLGASRTLAEYRPILVSELTGERGPEAMTLLDRLGYWMADLESGQVVERERRPFMIVAIPSEVRKGGRSQAILKALSGVSA